MTDPEPWLRGPVPGLAVELQPIAHTLVAVHEELVGRLATGIADGLWSPMADGWSIGQHVRHLAGSSVRLLSYVRQVPLGQDDRDRAASERTVPHPAPTAVALLDELEAAFDDVRRELVRLSSDPSSLGAQREVGRARLPSTVIGILFHIAEHAQRHAGQIAVLDRVQRRGGLPSVKSL